jgi:hypothetical protein
LVCGNCLLPGGDEAEGLLCKECGENQSQLEAQPGAMPGHARAPVSRNSIPVKAWVLFGLILLGLFALIVSYPIVQAGMLAGKMLDGTEAEAEEARMELVRLQNAPALAELLELAEHAPGDTTRALALEGLGYYTQPSATALLRRVEASPDSSPRVRLAAQNALIRQGKYALSGNDARE